MSKLKPCPLCGGDDIYHGESPCHYFECYNRKCQCAEKGWHETEEEAVAAWNNRPLEDKLTARIIELERIVRELKETNNDENTTD